MFCLGKTRGTRTFAELDPKFGVRWLGRLEAGLGHTPQPQNHNVTSESSVINMRVYCFPHIIDT
jgi:hypothetical protein